MLPIILLITLNIIDLITGIFKAIYLKKELSFKTFILGMINKVSMYFLIIICITIDMVLNYTVENLGFKFEINNLFCGIIVIWLIFNEQLSIIKNLKRIDTPMPTSLLNKIKILKEELEERKHKQK